VIAIDPPKSFSPWLSVWLAPRDTIARILATNPKRHVLLLAGLTAGLNVVGYATKQNWFDWRFFVPMVIFGAAVGILSLYINGLTFSWTGRLFAGRATPLSCRAVSAWASVPFLIGLVLDLVARLVLAQPNTIGISDRLAKVVIIVADLNLAVAGCWTVVLLALMLARVQGFGFWRTVGNVALGSVLGTFLTVLGPLLIALSIRTFLFQPFSLPSTSMMPTLLAGDQIFVSKFGYGYTRGIPSIVLPSFGDLLFPSEPLRGDVAVFRLPRNASADYVKRIVGLPNDRIQMIHGVLNINGVPVKQERLADFVWRDENGETKHTKRWRETLPEGATYETLDLQDNGFLDNTSEYVVPPGHYFMLGDNRDNSLDSRTADVGYVPFENLIGRVAIVYFSVGRTIGASGNSIRFDRIGTLVK
jgi:signal peptidase I